jgi:hypothetical protein
VDLFIIVSCSPAIDKIVANPIELDKNSASAGE